MLDSPGLTKILDTRTIFSNERTKDRSDLFGLRVVGRGRMKVA